MSLTCPAFLHVDLGTKESGRRDTVPASLARNRILAEVDAQT